MRLLTGSLLAGLALGAGCGTSEPAVEEDARTSLEHPAPAPLDRGEVCTDVGGSRVCWGEALRGDGCDSDACVAERVVPAWPAPRSGWRCSGRGSSRSCVDRAAGAGPFTCLGDRCVQLHPREPDDAEWECVEMDGVIVCRRRADAAGISPGPRDPAWTCGDDGSVCVDFAPDYPLAATDRWRCSFEYAPGARRVCVRDERALVPGERCGPDGWCGRGTRCVADRCLPGRPAPTCWLDRDCGGGTRCVFGTCA